MQHGVSIDYKEVGGGWMRTRSRGEDFWEKPVLGLWSLLPRVNTAKSMMASDHREVNWQGSILLS